MINQGMEKMVGDLIEGLKTSLRPERVLILARTTPEMVSIAKHADLILKRAEEFSRTCYEGDKRFLFQLGFPVGGFDEFAELWVANLYEVRPSAIDEDFEMIDQVVWPDEHGTYVVISFGEWYTQWQSAEEDLDFRPSHLYAGLLAGSDMRQRFEVGRPDGWSPPGRKVSVWDHLRQNLAEVNGKEVNNMAASKKTTKKPAAKKTAPKKAAPKAAPKKSAK
jgi:hypothetical protein